MILCWTLVAGGGEGDQWQLLSSVMSQGHKCPHRARRSSEQSQRSQPGRLGWRDCCQEEDKTTRRRRPVVLFAGEGPSSFSVWIFCPAAPSGEPALPTTALWATQAPLNSQVSEPGRPWGPWAPAGLERTSVGPVVSEGSQNSCAGPGGCQPGGPWLFKGMGSRAIRCSYVPQAAVNQADVCCAKNSGPGNAEASVVAAVASSVTFIVVSSFFWFLFLVFASAALRSEKAPDSFEV